MKRNRAFTLIELLVSIAIFALMTALLVVKYGNFNSDTLLTDTAYDIALAIRQAQTAGVSVQSAYNGQFQTAFGVDFNYASGGNPLNCQAVFSSNTFIYFSNPTYFNSTPNTNADHCTGGSNPISTYNIQHGAYISSLKYTTPGSSVQNQTSDLEITFVRPDPAAVIWTYADSTEHEQTAYITVSSADGSQSRTIVVQRSGQIYVQ
ncbi:MAG: type II secretion system protein [Patescibacteria group bacterium]|nr:type II secretion system GspH family protein [Patescibacteria group bacterium]MDE1941397.1 type II secretion system protein [Patescibacteria group bacterium]MDE1966617.1 type II secretion system protein [Patescibacteria group bacterium]